MGLINMAITYKSSGIDISIEAENGIYVYFNESASGKTKLLNYTKPLVTIGKLKAKCITYDDVVNTNGQCLNNMDSADLILLDRVDLYKDKLNARDLEEKSKNSIILIDCKSDLPNIEHGYALIDHKKDRMVVYDALRVWG